jgi:hypothetical protein
MTYTRSMFPRVDQTRRHLLTIEPMTRDDELGIAWWNSLTEQERARWSAIAGNTGRVKDAWEAFKRGSLRSPSISWDQSPPVEKARRRFLSVAAGASVVGVGSLAVAAAMPAAAIAPTVSARAADSLPASQGMDAASDALADALVRLIYAQEVYARAEDASAKWEAEHPAPKSRKGQRRWLKRLNAYRETFIPAVWQALMKAETDFADAHEALAAVPIAGMEDLKIMIAAAELYDGIELCRINRSPISRVVVAYVAEMARGGQS